jgi:hypothetical protein
MKLEKHYKNDLDELVTRLSGARTVSGSVKMGLSSRNLITRCGPLILTAPCSRQQQRARTCAETGADRCAQARSNRGRDVRRRHDCPGVRVNPGRGTRYRTIYYGQRVFRGLRCFRGKVRGSGKTNSHSHQAIGTDGVSNLTMPVIRPSPG